MNGPIYRALASPAGLMLPRPGMSQVRAMGARQECDVIFLAAPACSGAGAFSGCSGEVRRANVAARAAGAIRRYVRV